MLRRERTQELKDHAVRSSELAWQLARDQRFRRQLRSAFEHGTRASDRARHSFGVSGALNRLVNDQALLSELRSARRDLERAYGRLEAKRRRRRLRALAVLVLASAAAAPALRERLPNAIRKLGGRARDVSSESPEAQRLEDEALRAKG